MGLVVVVLLAGFVVAFTLVSRRIESLPVSGPMVFVAFGLLISPDGLDVVEIRLESESVVLLTEFTLAVLLFSDAAMLDVGALRRDPGLPIRLLGIGLPLSVAMGTGLTALLLTDLGVAEAALVAAILAPTDAALGQAVVTDERVPVRIRQSLNVESGLNDGLIVPVVAVFTAMVVSGDPGNPSEWVGEAGRELGIGVGVGLVVALVAGQLLSKAYERDWVRLDFEQLAMLSLGIGAYAAATELEGNGFIAAFVAGLTTSATMGEEADRRVAFSEDLGQLLALTTFVVFGATLVGPALGELTLAIAVCAVATLTVGRMVPVWIATVGAGLQPRSRTFIGWFGPRGLASMLFGLLLVEESGLDIADSLFVVVTWVVVLSIVAHGMTATPGANRYADWLERRPDAESMMETVPAPEPRVRWWKRL